MPNSTPTNTTVLNASIASNSATSSLADPNATNPNTTDPNANDLSLAQRFSAVFCAVPKEITLVCVSKTQPAKAIKILYELGQRHFGENYLQEALQKQAELVDCAICWHYIGHIQRNKTRDIANNFDWVHTLERAIIAKRLSEQRDNNKPPLNVLIQVNIDNEASKSGCQVNELHKLVGQILALPNLHLRGLMIIPSKNSSDAFLRTKRLFDDIKHRYNPPNWDTLSMGMSGDYQQAIAMGATMVRVGSAIFGER